MWRHLLPGLLAALLITMAHASTDISQVPLFVSESVPPLNMLVMSRDHKLYFEAYNDASDLNGDGVIDVGYKGYLSSGQGGIDYYGYFNSNVCYTHDGDKFAPQKLASGTNNKECSGQWSGDFLNYLATSRMDALRKVLYGGYRATDSTSQTILQAAFIPQDAHTWGKEYLSIAHDGYDIAKYAPLSTPPSGFRHLFAVVSLADNGIPQLRVLTNTAYRIWNWVSKERPVAGDTCNDGSDADCTSKGPDTWAIVPAEVLSGMTLTTWNDSVWRKKYSTAGSQSDMNTLFNPPYTNSSSLCGGPGSPTFTSLDSGTAFINPYSGNGCTQDDYHTLIEGKLTPTTTGTYSFSVDGDDAVDFSIDNSVIAYRYGDHSASNTGGNNTQGTKTLTAGTTYTFKIRHQENTGDASFRVYWKLTSSNAQSTLKNLNIRVTACPADSNNTSNASLREDNCTAYGTNNYKPTGILHDYGANKKMYFGLLSGSFQNNLTGGILRSPLQSFAKEINLSTGQFCVYSNNCSSDATSNGIVATIDKFRVIDFTYGSSYQYGCGWYESGAMTQTSPSHSCYMWGNPVGEMMYETLRYLAGATSATSAYSSSTTQDDNLHLPKITTWTPPYNSYPKCSVPAMTVISDTYPSYDYKLPGSQFDSSVTASPAGLSGLNVSTEADNIWSEEGGGSPLIFIGESNGSADSAPTPKTVSNLSSVRGLAPEEPSKQGTYYSAAIARFGAKNTIGGSRNLLTYSIALASPIPTIKFPVGSSTVTIVPFAKSVNGSGISPTGNFQPTDQIVDFYVETLANTDAGCPTSGKDCNSSINNGLPYAKFRINYEDSEQGADYDMDAISLYEVMANTDGTLTINMTSEYAAGGIDQHMGYIISGTKNDGIYLEVRDQGGGSDVYKLDTPDGKWAGDCALVQSKCTALTRLSSSRTFTPSGKPAAGFLENPLWYAAKYGTYPIKVDSDGNPENYFLVTNALTLKAQFNKALNSILEKNDSITQPTVTSTDNASLSDAYIYRTTFDSDGWTGDLIKEKHTSSSGQITTTSQWKASEKLTSSSSRQIKMANCQLDQNSSCTWSLKDFNWNNLSSSQQAALNQNAARTATDGLGSKRVDFIRGQTGDSSFRSRTSLLGDIVHSSPALVAGAQYLTYRAEALESSGTYQTFRNTIENRKNAIYVGANDGMLHAFDADTGTELFAFIPSAAISNLNKLTDAEYGISNSSNAHQYYVDGTPVTAEVYSGGSWHSILVGTLGAGGREVFALDITDPATPKLLWEFTSDDDGDLGYTLGKPAITRLHTGDWAVLIPNGYNSDSSGSGKAVLFVLNAYTGEQLGKLQATSSTAQDNGLSSIRPVDVNSDGITDYAYAGDLQGNLWRFDLLNTAATEPLTASVSKEQLAVAFGGEPLYVAKDDSSTGTRQPITALPQVIRHPSLKGYIVAFGTGRYLGLSDKTDKSFQTVYGIWDPYTLGETTNSSTPRPDGRVIPPFCTGCRSRI